MTCKTLIADNLVCGESAANIVAAGCVHEHIETDPICRRHLESLLNEALRCPDCWRCDNPHWCAMVGRVTS